MPAGRCKDWERRRKDRLGNASAGFCLTPIGTSIPTIRPDHSRTEHRVHTGEVCRSSIALSLCMSRTHTTGSRQLSDDPVRAQSPDIVDPRRGLTIRLVRGGTSTWTHLLWITSFPSLDQVINRTQTPSNAGLWPYTSSRHVRKALQAKAVLRPGVCSRSAHLKHNTSDNLRQGSSSLGKDQFRASQSL
jgi:hypothetical protein